MRSVFATAGLLALLTPWVAGAVIPGWGAATRGAAVAQSSASAQGTWTSDARSGWTDDAGRRRWQFDLRDDRGDNHWGFGIPPAELDGAPPADGTAANVQFSWTREAGVFRFAGSMDRGRGSGRYTFAPSAAYATAMQGLGYRLDAEDMQRFAVLDLTTAYVRDLAGAGYRNIDIDELVRMRIHQVTPDFIRGLADRGYKGLLAEDLIRMRIHGVTVQELDELKTLGFGGLGADELVRFRIHKVTPAYIREMRGVGFATVTEDQLLRMRIHKVDAQFVKDARADGYAMATPGDALDLAIRGPRYTRARRK